MESSKIFRLIFVVSLAILGVLVGFALIRPATAGQEYSEVSREQLIQVAKDYVVQFDITNHEGEDRSYKISISFDNYRFSQDVLIPDDRTFTYAQHVYAEQLVNKDVSFAVYKEGESQPFEQITYHLK